MAKIRIGIAGYGNVAKGVEKAVSTAPDMELRAVFTRRPVESVQLADSSVPVYSLEHASKMTGQIDVMLLCGGSASDLASQGPWFAGMYNIVDSYDNHSKIPEYLATIDEAAKNTAAIVSSGWDPGLFSIFRLLSQAVLPDGDSYTFWGYGVSQGHSEAIRRINGVKSAVQYTVPKDDAIEKVRSGVRPELNAGQKHKRVCYVVTESGADRSAIEQSIKSIPYYFSDYDTTVNFIGDEEFIANHSTMPHGGLVMHSGNTGENAQSMEFSLKLDSNPEFTGSVMAAYARAVFRLARDGRYGAYTVYDVPLSYLSHLDRKTLVEKLL